MEEKKELQSLVKHASAKQVGEKALVYQQSRLQTNRQTERQTDKQTNIAVGYGHAALLCK